MNDKVNHIRPYWHVDAKWVSGLVLSVALAIFLLVLGVYRLSSRSTAIEVTARVTASLFSRSGLDDPGDIAKLRSEAVQQGKTEVHPLSPDITITLNDLQTLSPRDVRLKVFRQLAAKMYDLGPQGISQTVLSQGGSQQQADKAASDAFAFGFLTAKTHQQLLMWLVISGLAGLLLAGIMSYFADGAGRLAAPALVLLYVSWPALPLLILTSTQSHNRGGQPDIGSIISFVSPLVTGAFAFGYTAALALAAVLLVGAGIIKGLHKRRA